MNTFPLPHAPHSQEARLLRKSVCMLFMILSTLTTLPGTLSAESAFQIDASMAESGPIGNRFSNVSLWSYLGTSADERMFHEWAEAKPAGWIKQIYPWLEEAQIYIASGGSYLGYPRQSTDTAGVEFNRDLFKDPADRSVLDDYDFEPLVRACRNMLRQGIKPCLKLHNVPIKYTAKPKIDWFRVNTRPPDNYKVYANYISALVQSMVDAFGLEEVSQWRWYIGTEFENATWFEAANGTPRATAKAFLKLYDWSVYAIERVLGEEAGLIGSHAMMNDGLWDPEIFFQHCRAGKNFATGKTGSRLDFFAVSQYDRTAVDLTEIKEEWPELKGTDNVLGTLDRQPFEGVKIAGNAQMSNFETKIQKTRQVMKRHGFGGLSIEVSEGGMVYGTDGKWLWHGLAMGGAFDATWTALSFKKMLETDTALWSRWLLLRTGGFFSGAEPAATNVLRLIYRMSGDRMIEIAEPANETKSQIIASMTADGSKLRILAFHHSPTLTEPNPPEKINLNLENLPFNGQAEVRIWRVDDEHSNFWPQWEADREAYGITDDDFYQSRDQVDQAHALLHPEHIAFWKSKEAEYRAIGKLADPTVEKHIINESALSLELELPCFGVALIEINEAR